MRVTLSPCEKSEARARRAHEIMSDNDASERVDVDAYQNSRFDESKLFHSDNDHRSLRKMDGCSYPNEAEKQVIAAAERLMVETMARYDVSHDAYHGEPILHIPRGNAFDPDL